MLTRVGGSLKLARAGSAGSCFNMFHSFIVLYSSDMDIIFSLLSTAILTKILVPNEAYFIISIQLYLFGIQVGLLHKKIRCLLKTRRLSLSIDLLPQPKMLGTNGLK